VGRKLPLIYVIDSILKNAKGQYVPIIERTASEWIDATYKMMEHREEERGKLRKVVNTWRDFNIFQSEAIDLMSKVFDEADAAVKTKVDSESAFLTVTPAVKKQMQLLLNSLHEGMDELQKISLERLAQINPKLLEQIRQEAMDLVSRNVGSVSTGKNATSTSMGSCICVEARSPQEIERSLEWLNIDYVSLDQGKELVSSLQNLVLEGAASVAPPKLGTNGNELMNILLAASAASKYLSQMMQKTSTSELKGSLYNKKLATNLSVQKPWYPSFMQSSGPFFGKSDAQRNVSKDSFTNEGLKERNSWAIGSLYDQGLPFVSSADGHRFATQLELSRHIDTLFRKR
jgi:pre-mRNA cleavage complex 2 protein Pcf11